MKSFDELGITHGEHASMVQVRNLFASGTIMHSPTNVELPSGSAFYMGSACFRVSLEEASSGALMCIGGWIKAFELGIVDVHAPYETLVAEEHERAIIAFVADAEGGLHRLFHPDISWSRITPAVVARAIDAFLEQGSVDWDAIATAAGQPALILH
ncbi:MAG: hypothetical protein DI537_10590 [Stutzerimonas stutzeri]|nr:MAG: hypothetical protein DI537_10590 [Stutzerimonas stutzeri]